MFRGCAPAYSLSRLHFARDRPLVEYYLYVKHLVLRVWFEALRIMLEPLFSRVLLNFPNKRDGFTWHFGEIV